MAADDHAAIRQDSKSVAAAGFFMVSYYGLWQRLSLQATFLKWFGLCFEKEAVAGGS